MFSLVRQRENMDFFYFDSKKTLLTFPIPGTHSHARLAQIGGRDNGKDQNTGSSSGYNGDYPKNTIYSLWFIES